MAEVADAVAGAALDHHKRWSAPLASPATQGDDRASGKSGGFFGTGQRGIGQRGDNCGQIGVTRWQLGLKGGGCV
ncbi:MAG: hypothetical protein WCK65_05310 [Rhodospirillaceae bacterium]